MRIGVGRQRQRSMAEPGLHGHRRQLEPPSALELMSQLAYQCRSACIPVYFSLPSFVPSTVRCRTLPSAVLIVAFRISGMRPRLRMLASDCTLPLLVGTPARAPPRKKVLPGPHLLAGVVGTKRYPPPRDEVYSSHSACDLFYVTDRVPIYRAPSNKGPVLFYMPRNYGVCLVGVLDGWGVFGRIREAAFFRPFWELLAEHDVDYGWIELPT